MKFLIKYLIILILITSCELNKSDNKIIDYVEEKKTEIEFYPDFKNWLDKWIKSN